MWLFALLVIVPIIEIALFIQIGGAIGLWPTLGFVILTAVVGTLLLRTQGIATMQSLQSSVAEGRNPMNPIAHGALILASGLLLLTPGFFTDAIGFILLVPPVRTFLIKRGAAHFTSVQFAQQSTRHPEHPERPASRETIDGDYSVVDEDQKPGSSGWTRHPE